MTMQIAGQVFRFLDLPREIRNSVYRMLLCDFSPPPTTVILAEAHRLQHASHDIDTSILFVNSAISKEASEVLIKTNRFVKITSPRELPLLLPLNALRVPVVSEEARVVSAFKGYVLSLDLSCTNPYEDTDHLEGSEIFVPFTLMILHRDLDRFCLALSDGDAHWPEFSASLGFSITMAPVLHDLPRMKHVPSIEEFFSKTTQEKLLAPFRVDLYGYKNVEIKGPVEATLAVAVREDMGRQQWSDPAAVIAHFSAAKEEGSNLFRSRRAQDACLCWQDAALDLEKVQKSSSWPSLVKQGGKAFVSQISELYFLMQLNVAHHYLRNMQIHEPEPLAGLMANNALDCAINSATKDFWMDGYKYSPSVTHMAKFRFRYALCLRLQAEPDTANSALGHIEKAMRLQPDDPAIIKERQNILAWMQRI